MAERTAQDRIGCGQQGHLSQTLLEMFQQMETSRALPQVLDGICRKTVENFGVSCAVVFDLGAGGAVQVANHGIPADTAERFVRFRHEAGRVPRHEDFRAGRAVVVSRARAPSREERAWLDSLRLYSAAAFPLRTGAAGGGALVVGIREARDFTREQLLDLEVVAYHAATAMVLAGFLQNAENAVRFRAGVSALAVELNAESDRARALRLLCARGCTIFNAAWGAVLMRSGDRLLEMAADGDIAGAPDTLSVPLSDQAHPAARAFSSGDIVVERTPAPGGFQSTLAIPLAGEEGPAGVLFFRKRSHSPEGWPGMAGDAKILGALAGAVLRNLDLMARLHSANAELRRANILKDQLLANASHDLRTPLNVIIGYGQLALEGTFGEPTEELRDAIERMVKSACDQLTLVEDLLNLSRIELNILPVRPVDVALAPLFSELEFMIANLVRDRPIRPLVAPLPPDLCVRADPDRLRQILSNLINNAAKFTDAGFIELSAWREGHRVHVAVRDTGIGIAPEHHSIIFDPFTQVDEKRAQMGTGLGLAIARRLAHMMGGSLTVESELGVGSTFRLTLPGGGPVETAACTLPSRLGAGTDDRAH